MAIISTLYTYYKKIETTGKTEINFDKSQKMEQLPIYLLTIIYLYLLTFKARKEHRVT